MKSLVTGGAGFIGHNLALELKRRGADVSVVDGLQVNNLLSLYCDSTSNAERGLYIDVINERIELLRSMDIPLYVEDARDYARLNMLLGRLKPQVIVFLAAASESTVRRSSWPPVTSVNESQSLYSAASTESHGR